MPTSIPGPQMRGTWGTHFVESLTVMPAENA